MWGKWSSNRPEVAVGGFGATDVIGDDSWVMGLRKTIKRDERIKALSPEASGGIIMDMEADRAESWYDCDCI